MIPGRPPVPPLRWARWPVALLHAALAFLSACEAMMIEPPVARPGVLDAPFAVSNFFTPSGHMGDGARAGFLRMDVHNAGCLDRPEAAVGDCYRFVYRPGDNRWAGAYWVYPANNWGSRAGRRVDGPRFKQVRLMAASETPDLVVNFIVGGIADPTLPNRDLVSAATSERLGPTWKLIQIDISGQEFERVIGALAWSVAYPQDWNGEDPVVIYLDDIVWDTEPVEP